MDGWRSLLSGIGHAARDKRESHYFQLDLIDIASARELYRGDPLAARIIEAKPNDMTREGFDFVINGEDGDDSKSVQEDIENAWEELNLIPSIHQALCWESGLGGAAVLIGVDDGAASFQEPLNLNRVRRGVGVQFLTPLEPDEIVPVTRYSDPTSKKFNEPEFFQLATAGLAKKSSSMLIHESRLLVFPGNRISKRVHDTAGGWGDSILTRVHRVLRDFNLTWSAAGILVVDFAQAVYKMEGLNELLKQDPKDIFKHRMLGMVMAQSVARMVMIDSKDEYERQQTPVAGLPELMDRFATQLAAAADLPLPLLLGESPGGLNASGASGDQLRMHYDRCAALVRRKVVPSIRKITEIQLRARGIKPPSWTIKPRPLWQLTGKEKAEERKLQAEIDVSYIDRGVLTSEEVRSSRFGGDTYSVDTTIEKPETEVNSEAEPATVTASSEVETPDATTTSSSDIQKTAFNGTQVESLLSVIQLVATGKISRASGSATLQLAFQFSPGEAEAVLGPPNFVPAAESFPATAALTESEPEIAEETESETPGDTEPESETEPETPGETEPETPGETEPESDS